MNNIELLTHQTRDAYHWTNELIGSVPDESWDQIPDTIATNITWQVGHLLVSFYYHSIWVITGHQMDILQKVPLKEYDLLFTAGSPANTKGKIPLQQLKHDFLFMQERSIRTISTTPLHELTESLDPGAPAHPVVGNKQEAISWNINHTMWHCGQLAILKRLINGRIDFGLKR